MENFRCIKEFSPRYWISDLGRVFDCEERKFLKQFLRGSSLGYYSVKINKKNYYIHRLIAQAFIENPLKKECIDHINGDTHNNKLDNLRWVTLSENQQNKRGVKGCTYRKDLGKWHARVIVNKIAMYSEFFDTEEEAHQAYLREKKIYHPSAPIR